MSRKQLHQILLAAILSLFTLGLYGQKTLPHERFLERMKHSNDTVYKECVGEYDRYLDQFPDDVSVSIEKCKFIQHAQYDEDEDYNPHQAEFDSCANALIERFPANPQVFLFQTTYLWGDDLTEMFKNAEEAIREHPGQWNRADLAALYLAMSDHYFYNDTDYKQALTYMENAISHDSRYRSSLEYARILLKMNRKEEALKALSANRDTSDITWQLTQKADLFLELKAYPEALELYDRIAQIDSTYNNNSGLATTLEGIGQYEPARKYLVSDTAKSWNKEQTIRNLFKHDLKYSDAATSVATYNEFRDTGYWSDPLGFYRLQLFFTHPLQPWKFRDVLGIMALMLLIAALIIIPYVWILPVYFVGHHWKFLSQTKPYQPLWGLRMFWLVSVGYLLSSLFSCIVEPEQLYSSVNSSYFDYHTDMPSESIGFESLVFTILMALFGFAAMYKVNPNVLLSNSWSIRKSILTGAGVLLAYKILSGIYIKIGIQSGISVEDLANIPNILLSSRQDIDALISTYGKGASLLLVGLLVPVYEEIMFRGVVLDSCQRYINFNTANIFQSALFALVHMSWFLSPAYFLFGILTGIMRKKSDGLLPGIVFHALNNTLVLLFLFAE